MKLIPESITIDFIFVSYRSLKSLLRNDTREIVLEELSRVTESELRIGKMKGYLS